MPTSKQLLNFCGNLYWVTTILPNLTFALNLLISRSKDIFLTLVGSLFSGQSVTMATYRYEWSHVNCIVVYVPHLCTKFDGEVFSTFTLMTL